MSTKRDPSGRARIPSIAIGRPDWEGEAVAFPSLRRHLDRTKNDMTRPEFLISELNDALQESESLRSTVEEEVGESFSDHVGEAAADVKPELEDGNVTRAEFDEMSPGEQADHIKSGGTVVDA